MTTDALQPAGPKRLPTVLLFAALGPAIGALAVCAFFLMLMLMDPSTASGAVALTLGAAIMFVIFGYWMGFAPALLTGLLFAFAPAPMQRVFLSPLYGVAAVWIASRIGNAVSGGAMGGGSEPFMLAAGAFAALVCALIAARAGWLGSPKGL